MTSTSQDAGPESGTRTAKPIREAGMDVARGLMILLVIVYHVCEVVQVDSGFHVDWLDTFNRVVGPVRMPLMMFLSGMVLAPALSKGLRRFAWTRVRGILWPYLLWSIITVVAFNLASTVTDTGHSWSELLTVFTVPPGGLWFLQYLLGYYILAITFQCIPRPVLIATTLAASATVWMLTDLYGARRFLLLFAFFLLGDVISRYGRRLLDDWRIGVAGGVVAVVLIPIAVFSPFDMLYNPLLLPCSIGGVLAVMYVARRAADASWARPLRFVGRNSITFYLTHWLCAAAASEVADVLLPHSAQGTGAIVAAIVVATLAPAVIVGACRRFSSLKVLFVFPRVFGADREGDRPRRTPAGNHATT